MKLKKAVWWWAFPLHQLLGTIGIGMLAGLLTFTFLPAPRARWILTETPLFPVEIVLAFCIGFVLRRHFRHEIMEWVWILPFLFLCFMFIRMNASLGVRLEHFFGWGGCRPEFHCFDQLGVTAPLYTAAAYSFGAFLSRNFKTRAQSNEQRNKASSRGT